MDTKLKDGNFDLSHSGVPQWVRGTDAWMQKAMLRLCVRRGAFRYDRKFGGHMHELCADDPAQKWKETAAEALLPEPALQIQSAVPEKAGCRLRIRTPDGVGETVIPYSR